MKIFSFHVVNVFLLLCFHENISIFEKENDSLKAIFESESYTLLIVNSNFKKHLREQWLSL